MKLRLTKFALMLIVACTISSCSAYYKLLKSDDAMAKYGSAMELYNAEKYSKAISLFDSAMPTLIGTPYEDTILFTLGKCFYNSKDFTNAGETMNSYRNQFPRSTFTPEAEYIYAMSFYNLSGDVEKDQTNTKRAISAFGEYITRYPNSKFTPEIKKLSEELTNKLYYKEFLNGALYYKLGHYLSAITSLRAVLKADPETPYKEDILYLTTKSWFDYAKNSVYSRQLDRYLKTIDSYYTFAAAFPDSKQFGKELSRMKDIAQDFIDKNGTTSQSIESSVTKIENARKAIEDSKEALFLAHTKEERQKLQARIKESREIIRVESKKAREEEKIMNANKREKQAEIRALEKAEIAREKAEEAAKKDERKQRVEELRNEANKTQE